MLIDEWLGMKMKRRVCEGVIVSYDVETWEPSSTERGD